MEKKFKHGLILGKFMPLHNGHMYLITNGVQQCDNLTVLMCSLEREPIPGTLRAQWVNHYCSQHHLKDKSKKINVIHIDYDLPQEPSEHPDFWNIWCDLIIKHCPEIDAIFTSEDYGFELAKRLNIQHVLVDKDRIKVPVSGTVIRENPYKNWEFIYRQAREYFVNRIYILGPESTGKSTMCERLSSHFDASFVPEYGRQLWEQKFGSLHYMDFFEIAVIQRYNENRLAAHHINKPLLFCDTEVMTTKVFGELMCPDYTEILNPFFDYHINQQIKNNTGHYFVMSPDGIEAVQDGTRSYLEEKPRKKHFDLIVFELRRRNVPFTILTGSYEARFNQMCFYIECILQRSAVMNLETKHQ